MQQALIAGAGIGGLAAALACARAGWQVRLFERADVGSEAGAGLQLGPNAVQVLHHWGLQAALAEVACFPEQLILRSGLSNQLLASRPLGQAMMQRYGACHITLHRADLHAVLLQAVQQHREIECSFRSELQSYTQGVQEVTVQLSNDAQIAADVLIGADGLHSQVRQQLLANAEAYASSHVACRALLEQNALPAYLRSSNITAWLGPGWHAVQYPVRAGQWLNTVFVIHASGLTLGHAIDSDLRSALPGACQHLQDVLQANPSWHTRVLFAKAPVQGPDELAQGRIALLGDAAHPMLPHLGQGAGMALEDAFELGRALRMQTLPPEVMLRRYALNRWQRNARVQTQSLRNGQLFQAQGVVCWARNAALRLLGARLLDVPWLYRGIVS